MKEKEKKIKIKYNKKIFAISIMAIAFIFLIASNNNPNSSIMASDNLKLSNRKIGWGIKRNDNHEQPDLGARNKELIEKYEGIAMGKPDEKNIYLTFDEGYEAGYTSKILDILKENNVSASFFITAAYLNTNGELVKRMINEGHIVGNHAVSTIMSVN